MGTSGLGSQRKGVLGSWLSLLLSGGEAEQGAPGSFAVGLWEGLLIPLAPRLSLLPCCPA